MNYIGIDNGVTGTIGVVGDVSLFVNTPVKKEQNYTKKEGSVSRIDVVKLREILVDIQNPFALLERPFVNPKMFNATLSAIRALEATLNVIEILNIPYTYMDSKQWQGVMLPSGVKGSADLKKASLDIGCRLFPKHRELIEKHGDADGLLMAEYWRRAYGKD